MTTRGRASIAAISALIACVEATGVACGPCQSPNESGPGPAGNLTYVTGDGRSVTSAIGGELDVTSNAITLTDSFTDADGAPRGYTLTLDGLTVGAIDLTGHGQVCFARETNGTSVCSNLQGSVVVHALSTNCQTKGSCAYTVDATLSATSPWQGTTLTLNATFTQSGAWVKTQCEAD